MKVAIIGADGMGCLFGAYLSKHHDVILMDSFLPLIDAIISDGISVLEHGYRTNYQVKAAPSGTDIGIADLVILFADSLHTYELLEANRSILGEHTMILSLQNGAGNDRDIMHFIKKENIMIGVTRQSIESLGPGKVNHISQAVTTIGSLSKNNPVNKTVKSILKEAGFETELSDQIQRLVWRRMLINHSVHTLSTRLENNTVYSNQSEYAKAYANQLIQEAAKVAEEDGTYFDQSWLWYIISSKLPEVMVNCHTIIQHDESAI